VTTDTRGTVELRFGDGTVINAWERFALRDNYTDPLGSLSFTAKPPKEYWDEYRAKLQKGSLVHLRINDNPQATPIITTSRSTLNKDGLRFEVEAKSVLATPYEGSVDPHIAQHFDNDTPVGAVVLEALGPYGFETIETDTAGAVAAMTGKLPGGRAPAVVVDELKHKDIQAQPSEKAYAFCSRIFSRLAVVLRVNPEGHLLLGAPDFGQSPSYSLVQDSDHSRPGDRMLDEPGIDIVDTNDGQYSECVATGKTAGGKQASASTPRAGVIGDGIERPSSAPFSELAHVTIPAGRHNYKSDGGAAYKPNFWTDKSARDKERCEYLARAMMGVRARNAWTMRCSVAGLVSVSGAVWSVDTVATVYAEAQAVDEDLWILETIKTGEKRGGQRTALTLIPLNSLVLGEVSG